MLLAYYPRAKSCQLVYICYGKINSTKIAKKGEDRTPELCSAHSL